MSRLLAPRPWLVATALMGFLTTGLALAGEFDLALAAAGLAFISTAGSVWSAFSRLQKSLNRGAQTDKAVTRLASSLEVTDRRLVAAIESLRRDVHNHDRTPPL